MVQILAMRVPVTCWQVATPVRVHVARRVAGSLFVLVMFVRAVPVFVLVLVLVLEQLVLEFSQHNGSVHPGPQDRETAPTEIPSVQANDHDQQARDVRRATSQCAKAAPTLRHMTDAERGHGT